MGQHEDKIALLSKFSGQIRTSFDFHIKGSIPSKKIDNALKTYAQGLDRTTIIGFYDTTLRGSGKSGYIFTDTKIYYLETMEKPKKLWYDDIERVELFDTHKKACDQGLRLHMYDGTTVTWTSCFLNKPPLAAFLNEIIKMVQDPAVVNPGEIKYKKTNTTGATAGGVGVGNYSTVNKVFEEEKFHSQQGHGFAAERANNLFDNLTGHDAKILGDDNQKNGADRMVDGVYIQSKYCATGSRCINECFENDGKGAFRYMIDGEPMQIEVPADKYDDAVRAMEEKIKRGQVEGVSDPARAKKIVRKGHFKYQQAKNIAKAGTVESLTYDSVNGVITATSALGVTAVISFATAIWNGEGTDQALKTATYSGMKVFGTTFLTSVVASQLSKAGLNSALVGSSEAIVKVMGPKASATLINAFRGGKAAIHGATAMKSAAKLLRSNAITATVTVAVLSSFDVANIFRGRISGKQLFKNLTNTATTVAGGTGGWIAGAAAGSAILPGVGTVVGGLLGSVLGGGAAGKATDKLLGFIEDDADAMVKIIQDVFEELASEYLLSQKEAEKSVDKLKEKLDGKKLKDMYASADKKQFARNLLVPIVENEVAKRRKISLPSDEQLLAGMREILEELSDAEAESED